MGKLAPRSADILSAAPCEGDTPTCRYRSGKWSLPAWIGSFPGAEIPQTCAFAFLAMSIASSAFAQSPPAPAAGAPAPKAQPPIKETPAADAARSAATPVPVPSRYATEDLKAYIEGIASQLAIASRASDPFGQLQDPNAKPVVKPTVAKTVRRVTAEPPASLSDIVSKIEITTIMPRDKRFLVGSRNIGQGDKIPITFRNKQIHTEVTEVSSRRIVFRNVDTGEIGIRQLNLLPSGMTPGTRNITAPGMVPANPNTPLEVDVPPPSTVAPTNP